MATTPYKPDPMTKGTPTDDIAGEEVAGGDLKKARGLESNAGHSPNEAGTDQRVEDAKKNREKSREQKQ